MATTEQQVKDLLKTGAAIDTIRRKLDGMNKEQLDALIENLTRMGAVSDENLAKLAKAVDDLKTRYDKIIESQEKSIAKAQQQVNIANSNQQRAEREIELVKQKIKLQEELLEQGEEVEDELKRLNKELDNLENSVDRTKKAVDSLSSGFGDLLKGNLTSGLKSLGKGLGEVFKKEGLNPVGKFKDQLFGLTKKAIGGSGGAIAALGGLAAGFIAVGIAAAAWKKIFKLAIEVGDAQSAFMKATGASREFASSLSEVTEDVRRFGASAKEAGESFQALFTGVSDFTMMSAGAREEITKSAVALSKLGVSNQDFARGSQIAIKAMGQTGVQAAATQREIAALGMDIGVAPSKMAADFAAAGPQLAKFGSDGVQTFKDLAVAAKVTGIEVGRLMSITGKFDTFEGAASAAGKLNAALGGNFVNAMELVTATDPVERMNMIRDSILDAGLSFDTMSYYQRKFFAESAGLEGEAELAALMSGNMDSLAGNIGKTSDQYADMAEKAAKAQSFQEKINTLMMALIPVVEPIVEMLTSLSDWMMENMDAVALGMKTALVLVTGLAAGITALGIAFLVSTLPITGTMVAIGLVVAALTSLATLLFVESFASSFLEGLFKIGNGFAFIAEMATFAANPIGKLIGEMGELAAEFFTGDKSILVGTKMTSEGLDGVGTGAQIAANASGNLVTAQKETMREITRETNNNYNGSTGETKVNINFANSRFKDFFDVEVENSIGRAARKAVI